MAEDYNIESVHVHSIPQLHQCEDESSMMTWELIMEGLIEPDKLQTASDLIDNEIRKASISFDYKGERVLLMTVKFTSYTEGWRSAFLAMRLLEQHTCAISSIQGEPIAAWHMQFAISEL